MLIFTALVLLLKSCNRSHITKEQRYTIGVMIERKFFQKESAAAVGLNQSNFNKMENGTENPLP